MEPKTSTLHAWLIWLLSAAFMFYKNAIEVSPSVMTTQLMSAFQIDGAQLGNLAACYFYAYLVMQIPAGLLIDRLGPRKVTTIAIGLCGAGALIFANAELLIFAQIGRFLSGAGAAFAAINCLKLIANWFPTNRFAFMAGLMMTVGMFGSIGGQAPLYLLMNALGWREALDLVAFIGLILAVLFWFIVRDRSKHEHLLDVKFTGEGFSLKKSLKHIWMSKQSWYLSWYSGLAFAPVMIFGGLWGVSFVQQSFQTSHAVSAHTVSLIFFGFAIGAPLAGWISDTLGRRRNVMLVGTLLSILAICPVLYIPNLSLVIASILLFCFGFFISFFLLCFTMIREINPPAIAATAVGFMNAFDALFGAISDPLTGKFLDLGWQGQIVNGARLFPLSVYKWALSIIPIYLALSLVFLFFIKETFCKSEYPNTLP